MGYVVGVVLSATLYSTVAGAYQRDLNCFPCVEEGVHTLRFRCDTGDKAKLVIDDPVAPQTIEYYGPAAQGAAYADETTLEESIALACGE